MALAAPLPPVPALRYKVTDAQLSSQLTLPSLFSPPGIPSLYHDLGHCKMIDLHLYHSWFLYNVFPVDANNNPIYHHLVIGGPRYLPAIPGVVPFRNWNVRKSQQFPSRFPQNSCNHTIPDLLCGCGASEVVMFYHTLYYYTPQEVADIMYQQDDGIQMRRNCFAIIHDFIGGYGRINTSLDFEVDETQNVICSYRRGNRRWSHNTCRMLLQGVYVRANNQGGYLLLRHLTSIKNTSLYELQFLPGPRRIQDVTLMSARSLDEEYYGDLTSTTPNIWNKINELIPMRVTIPKMISLGPVFLLYGTSITSKIYIPKGYISALQTYMVATPRTQSTFMALKQRAERLIDEYPHIVTQRHEIVRHGLFLAYVSDLQSETTLLNKHLASNTQDFVRYNMALSGTNIDAYSILKHVLVASAATVTALVLTKYALPWLVKTMIRKVMYPTVKLAFTTAYKTTAGVVAGAAPLALNALAFGFTLPLSKSKPIDLLTYDYLNFRKYPAFKPQNITETVLYGAIADKDMPLPDEKAVGLKYTGMVVEKVIKPQLLCAGILHAPYIPYVYTPTQRNMALSLVYRHCRVRPLPVQATVDDWLDFMSNKSNLKLLFPNLKQTYEQLIPHYTFTYWNSRFPQSVQLVHNKAMEALKIDWKRGMRYCTYYKAFIKREKYLKLEYTIPRSVMDIDPHFKVYISRHILCFADSLKKVWDEHFPIYYTSGATAEQLGNYAVQAFGPSVVVECTDLVKHDGSMTEEIQLGEMKVYEYAGLPRTVLKMMYKAMKKTIFTRHGLIIRVKGKRASGVPHTSCGNTIAVVCTRIFSIVQQTGYSLAYILSNIRILDLGDDMILFRPRRWNLDPVNGWRSVSELGYELENQFDVPFHNLDFCSGLFYPCKNSKGDSKIIWGPKIGKILPKIGCFLYKQNIDGKSLNRAVALSFLRDTNHIPIVRTTMLKLEQLTRGSTPDKYEMRELNKRPHTGEKYYASDDTYTFMYQRYKVTKNEVTYLESLISAITQLPVLFNDGIMHKIMAVDLASVIPPNFLHSLLMTAYTEIGSAWNVDFVTSMYINVFAPIAEEHIKRVDPVLKHLLIWGEFIGYTYMYPYMAPIRLYVVYKHYQWAKLDYIEGVRQHSWWNAVRAPIVTSVWRTILSIPFLLSP